MESQRNFVVIGILAVAFPAPGHQRIFNASRAKGRSMMDTINKALDSWITEIPYFAYGIIVMFMMYLGARSMFKSHKQQITELVAGFEEYARERDDDAKQTRERLITTVDRNTSAIASNTETHRHIEGVIKQNEETMQEMKEVIEDSRERG